MTLKTTAIGACALAALASTASLVARTQQQSAFDEALLRTFAYRNTGPFRMGARTSDIAVPTRRRRITSTRSTSASGPAASGRRRTTGRRSSRCSTGRRSSRSATSPSRRRTPNIVWVGTGDAFTSRSSYAGDGVYKSTDAGKTWKNMGLRDSHHIARIAIHPTNPDIVYVAAMGHLYSDERRARRVQDDERRRRLGEGALRQREDRRHRSRDESEESGRCSTPRRTTSSGCRGRWSTAARRAASTRRPTAARNWTRLAADCRPAASAASASTSSRQSGHSVRRHRERRIPTVPRRATAAADRGGAPRPSAARSIAPTTRGQTWTKMNADDYNVSPKGPYYFSQIRVDPGNDQNIFVTQDGYRRFARRRQDLERAGIFPRMFGDYRTLWIDPENPERMIAGSDGGIAISYDGGRTSDHYANMPGRRDLLDRRRHGGSVQPLRRPAGSRALEGAVERAARPRDGVGLARRRRQRRHLHAGRSDATAAGCTRRGSTAATRGSIRSWATRRTSGRSGRRAIRIASSGARRCTSRRTTAT